jgi:hypothetical protein
MEIAVLSHPSLSWNMKQHNSPVARLHKCDWEDLKHNADIVSFTSLEYTSSADFDKSKRVKLQDNLTQIYIALNIIRTHWDLKTLIEFASTTIWEKKPGSVDLTSGELLVSKDLMAIGAVVRHFERIKKTDSQILQKLQVERAQVERSNFALTDEVEQLRALVTQQEVENRNLQNAMDIAHLEIERNSSKFRADLMEVSSELISLRARSERQLVQNLDTLVNALHALQNGRSPVTEDFLKLCIANMKIDIEIIEKSKGKK